MVHMMQRKWKQRLAALWRSEEGQSLAFIAMSMMVLVGVVGLVTDYGYAHVLRTRMQQAADTAALSGARELADNQASSVAVERMRLVLIENGADPNVSTYAVTAPNRTEVTAEVQVPTIFLGAFNISQIRINASAEAAFGRIVSNTNLMPFAVEEQLWAPGESVRLWGTSAGPGNFGWVRWSGQAPSASNTRANIDDPSRSDRLRLGDWVDASPGVSFRAVQRNLAFWIGQEISVFLYDPDQTVGIGANLDYQVVGFANFILTDVISRGNDSEIRGEFVGYVTAGQTVVLDTDPGLRGVVLVR